MADAIDAKIQALINAGASDDEIVSLMKEAHAAPAAPSTNTALGLSAAGAVVPAVQRGVEEVATHPSLVDAAGGLGRLFGGKTGLVKGGYLGMKAGEPVGEAVGRGSAALAQAGAGTMANALSKLAPYAQSLSTLGAAQAPLDLAQMAEPNRKDIGFLGISGDSRSEAERQAHPALLNMLLQKLLGK